MIAFTNTASRTLLRNSKTVVARTAIARRCLSVQGEEAVCKLKAALEQYRVENYQQTIPSRFKKEMVGQCNLTSSNAVEGIENLLQNIGVFGKDVTHDDVECIVSEMGEEEQAKTMRADTILSKLL